MKLIKSVKTILYNRIRDNSALAKYSNKEKAEELLAENQSLRLELDGLKAKKRF